MGWIGACAVIFAATHPPVNETQKSSTQLDRSANNDTSSTNTSINTSTATVVAVVQPQFVTTNLNAVQVDYTLNDDSVRTYYFYAKQDLPAPNTSSSPVPIRADVLFVKNDLVRNNVNTVTIVGSTQLQPPSIKSIVKSDLTSNMQIDLPNPSAVSVSFGFHDKAGIAGYDIFEKGTNNYFVQSGTVDLHSSSETIEVGIKSVELATGMDPSKTYTLRIKHTGTANPSIFDAGLDHKIYVGDVMIHRDADASQSVLEYVSNTAFANSSFLDNGSRNSLTGRPNFIEFYEVQTNIADGISSVFPVNGATINVRSVELDNGRGFEKLNQFIDWTTEFTDAQSTRQNVVMGFVPKQGAVIRIIYDVFSFALERKIEITQPRTFDGKYDRMMDLYVQNEAVFLELNASQKA